MISSTSPRQHSLLIRWHYLSFFVGCLYLIHVKLTMHQLVLERISKQSNMRAISEYLISANNVRSISPCPTQRSDSTQVSIIIWHNLWSSLIVDCIRFISNVRWLNCISIQSEETSHSDGYFRCPKIPPRPKQHSGLNTTSLEQMRSSSASPMFLRARFWWNIMRSLLP